MFAGASSLPSREKDGGLALVVSCDFSPGLLDGPAGWHGGEVVLGGVLGDVGVGVALGGGGLLLGGGNGLFVVVGCSFGVFELGEDGHFFGFFFVVL